MKSGLNSEAAVLLARLNQSKTWDQRYRELLMLAKSHFNDENLRTPPYEVDGCQSKVWLRVQEQAGQLTIETDSDARLIRALLLVMVAPLQGQSRAYVEQFDFHQWLTECGLADHLSASRANGLAQVGRQLKQRCDDTPDR